MENPEKLLQAAESMGLNAATLELMRLLPLVYVAWSDGELQEEELGLILESAESLGISSDESLTLLQSWLQEKPSDAFFKKGLRLLSYVVATMDEDEAESASKDVNALCDAVARAAGGLDGHSVRVEGKEQLALRQVVNRLNLGTRPATRATLASIVQAQGGKGGEA